MKKYILLIGIAILAVSCSKSHQIPQKKAEEAVKAYIKSHIDEADSYDPVSFGKLDSLQLGDTPVYQNYKQEKNRLEKLNASLKQRMDFLEKSGVRKSDRLYTELKDKWDENEKKLERVNKCLKELEAAGKEQVYSIQHKYKARKKYMNAIMEYNEFFYLDKDNHVIEDVTVYN